jgi:hypothetical protein
MELMAHIEARIAKAKADHPGIHLFAARGAYGIEINSAGFQDIVPYNSTHEAADAVLLKAVTRATARARPATPSPSKAPRIPASRPAERAWDKLYNEGGDGYNPHRHRLPEE